MIFLVKLFISGKERKVLVLSIFSSYAKEGSILNYYKLVSLIKGQGILTINNQSNISDT